MTVIIGNSSPVEGDLLEVDGPVLKLYRSTGKVSKILLAYHLHPGERVRLSEGLGKDVYEVTN